MTVDIFLNIHEFDSNAKQGEGFISIKCNIIYYKMNQERIEFYNYSP